LINIGKPEKAPVSNQSEKIRIKLTDSESLQTRRHQGHLWLIDNWLLKLLRRD